jgi:hypothetical protein
MGELRRAICAVSVPASIRQDCGGERERERGGGRGRSLETRFFCLIRRFYRSPVRGFSDAVFGHV